jgi:hypothetical protein
MPAAWGQGGGSVGPRAGEGKGAAALAAAALAATSSGVGAGAHQCWAGARRRGAEGATAEGRGVTASDAAAWRGQRGGTE